MFPNIAMNKSKSKYTKQKLENALQIAQNTLNNSLFINLKTNIKDRIEIYITINN